MKKETLVAGLVGGLIVLVIYTLLFGMGSWGGMMRGNYYGNPNRTMGN